MNTDIEMYIKKLSLSDTI